MIINPRLVWVIKGLKISLGNLVRNSLKIESKNKEGNIIYGRVVE